MKHHSLAYINEIDFQALKKFEQLHPELYTLNNSPKPQRHNHFQNTIDQIDAFNFIFYHITYSTELKALIQCLSHHP